MILAMENAGQLIEDEELRAQIKSCGIGTSATRAEILKKLVANKYIALNKKTQILTPTLQGEMIYDIVFYSIRSLLNPELTASWEKGLNYVAEGSVTEEEYTQKLGAFRAVAYRRRARAEQSVCTASVFRRGCEVLQSAEGSRDAGESNRKARSTECIIESGGISHGSM